MHKLTFTSDCQIHAAADKPARVDILAYSGNPMRLPGLGTTLVDLAGMALASIPLLADHDNTLGSIAGSGTPEIRSGQLHVSGTLASGTAAATQILALHRSGVRLQASIGAEIDASTFIDAGKSINANGRTHKAPAGGMTFVSKSTLREVSLVAMGADAQTTVSIAAMRGRQTMQSDFQTWAHSMVGASFSKMDSDDVARLHANYRGETEPTVEDFTATATLVQASYSDDEMRVRRLEKQVAMRERLEKLEAQIPMAHTVHSSQRDMLGNADVLTAALCLRGGMSKPEEHFPERVLDQADRIGRGIGLQSLLMRAACEHGYHAHPGEYINDGNIRGVLTAAFHPQIQASGWSTLAISNVLSNTANKMLMDGFAEMPSEWRSIAAIKSVNNFKEHTFVRLLDSLSFEEVGAAGEIKHGTLGDVTMTAKANTYAKMLTITRQDIINDDLEALTDVPRRLGRAAAQKFNSLFWTTKFLAADSFWHANNSNLLTGAGTSLDSAGAGLTAAIKAFRAQKSTTADGLKLIGGKPSIMLVPPALEIPARRLLNSSGVVSGVTTSMPDGNPFMGLCTLVVEDRLSAAEGGSDAYWYLLRSPSFAPSMLVPALNGRVEPTVETADADFNVLGISMRGYSDVGAARGEKLCGLRMDGTA